MTSPGNAKQIIIVSTVLSGALASIKPISESKTPPLALGVGVMFLAVFLLAIAEVAPKIAMSLALLVLVSATTQLGPSPLQTISSVLPKGKK